MTATHPGGGSLRRARPLGVGSLAWLLLGVAVLISLAGVSPPTLWARLFFGAVVLTGAVALAGMLDRRAPLAAAAIILLLVCVQRIVERPVPEPPSAQWARGLQGAGQLVQQEIAPPSGTAQWEALWRRASGAAVYVCARGPLAPTDGLELLANGVSLGTVSEAQGIGPRPGPTFSGFYRLPIARSLLEQRQPATFVLRRTPDASPRPVEICGSFTHRPTAGLDSSRYFDGASWWHPGPAQGGRFIVELRLEDANQRTLWVAY